MKELGLRHVAKLPSDLSGREVRAALERAGFVFRRQTGSHMMLRRDHLMRGRLHFGRTDPTGESATIAVIVGILDRTAHLASIIIRAPSALQ